MMIGILAYSALLSGKFLMVIAKTHTDSGAFAGSIVILNEQGVSRQAVAGELVFNMKFHDFILQSVIQVMFSCFLMLIPI